MLYLMLLHTIPDYFLNLLLDESRFIFSSQQHFKFSQTEIEKVERLILKDGKDLLYAQFFLFTEKIIVDGLL